jgi:diguanylate cyclase (GGDEF)-like protein/PAS domain S-box-containing protein
LESVDLYDTVFDTVETGIVVQRTDGHVIAINPAAERILGLTRAQFSGYVPLDPAWGVVDEDGAPWPIEELPAEVCRQTGERIMGVVLGVRRPDGTLRWLRQDSQRMTIPGEQGGGFSGVVTTFVDVTEYKGLHDSLVASEARFATGFDTSPIGMALVSTEGRFMRVNDAFAGQVGRTPTSLLGRHWTMVVSPGDAERLIAMGRSHEPGLGHRRAPVRLETPEGLVVHVEVSVALVHDPGGQVAHFFVQTVDVTERVRLAEELSREAVHDYLTGLLNRRGFAAALAAQWERTRRYGDTGALLMIDLNDFKSLNDTLGHGAGDQLLTDVAHILTGRLRVTDVVARVGGDEFAVILPKTDAQMAIDAAQAVLEELRQKAGLFGSASIGIALFDPDRSIEQTMFAADRAMYRAKATRQPRWEMEETASQDR